jgi:aspartyl-tRNA(Asn)/glutamyl-tRNA(Gln) amidotransferase subunit B
VEFSALKVKPTDLVELLQLLDEKKINPSTAKDILAQMLASGQSASTLITEKGLQQVSDEDLIQSIIQTVLSAHPQEVRSYVDGKEALSNWFFGQVMAGAKGKADPAVVKREINRALERLKS